MTNERYLIGSYFVGAVLSVGLGTLVYLFLRRPFGGVADAAQGKRLSSMLKRRLLPWELLFPALLDVSVSYQGCNRTRDSNKTLADAPNPLFIRITEGTNWR